jgi:hypothetical protein
MAVADQAIPPAQHVVPSVPEGAYAATGGIGFHKGKHMYVRTYGNVHVYVCSHVCMPVCTHVRTCNVCAFVVWETNTHECTPQTTHEHMYRRERLIMILGKFRAIRFMRAENSTPKLPLSTCRKFAIEQCQQNTPIPQPGAQMRPNFMRASCALHACFMSAAARGVTGGSRRRRPCRWNSFFSCALRARRPENHN